MNESYTRAAGLALATLLLAAGGAAAEPGHLLIIGGGTRGPAIMQRFAALAGGAKAKVVVFPMASEKPVKAGIEIVQELHALGLPEVASVNLVRGQADTDDALKKLEGATAVYFTGGDQSRITAVLHGTRVQARLREMYQNGVVMAGTSAGAAVMSAVMITGEERRPASKEEAFQTIESGNVVTAPGLGFLTDAIVDQHFVRRRRTNRLLSLVLERPQMLGIGIDEATAVWVKPDHTFEVVGDGSVLVYDAGGAQVARDEATHGLSGSGLKLHVLRSGSLFDLSSRQVQRLK
jgi:cyanophycinase